MSVAIRSYAVHEREKSSLGSIDGALRPKPGALTPNPGARSADFHVLSGRRKLQGVSAPRTPLHPTMAVFHGILAFTYVWSRSER